MNWKTIKFIYYCVLTKKEKIKYLGGDKYRLTTYYENGQKHWSGEYDGLIPHGRHISWYEDGTKKLTYEYIHGNGTLIDRKMK